MDISVIIPVYNSEKTIIEAVDSVATECATNPYSWEIILVNDGSPDHSIEVMNDYIAMSPFKSNFRLISQPNGGAAAARNTGLQHAKGTFVAFNDSDDRWLSGKLAQQMNYLQTNPDIVLLGGIYGYDNLSKIKKIQNPTVISIKDQVLKNYFSPPTVILRRKILEKTGLFNEKLRHAEEGYFFNNIVAHGKSVISPDCVAEPITGKARWGDSGLSGNLVKMEQGELFNIRAAYKSGYIKRPLYLFAICFSVAKFCRRWIISKFRKICK